MKKVTILILLFLLVPRLGICCDKADPICVAKILMEKSAVFKTKEIKEIYCSDNYEAWELGIMLEQYTSAVISEKDPNFLENVYHDLSNLKYELIDLKNETATVIVTGTYLIGLKGSDFLSEKQKNKVLFLRKEEGSQNYCFPEQDMLKILEIKKQIQANQQINQTEGLPPLE